MARIESINSSKTLRNVKIEKCANHDVKGFNKNSKVFLIKVSRTATSPLITDRDGFSGEYDEDGSGCDVTADHLNDADDEADGDRHKR